ncbi:MAG: hypothetical protein J6S38_01110, partial [Erysipelotrichaceae bacterium]|nr:hypothetical protein [Erysipelotrichaceae bacterium]
MRYIELLNQIETVLNDKDHSFLSYASLTEEALKIAIEAKNSLKPIIVVKENGYLSNRLKEILASYFDEDEIVSYLPEESLRAEEIASSFENRANRLNALYKIISDPKLKVIMVSPYGLIRHLPDKEELRSKIIRIRKDDVLDKAELIDRLKKLGYEKTSHVETPMTYASRGYIVDVFSINYDMPIRIEFFDDVIDSIRFFDNASQRKIEEIKEAEICFAKDVFFSDEEKKYLDENVKPLSGQMELELEYIQNDIYQQSQYFYYAYFDKSHLKDYFNDPIIYISNKEKIDEHLKMLSDETIAYIQEMHEEKRLPLKFYVYGEFNRQIGDAEMIEGRPFAEISKLNEIDFPYGTTDYVVNVLKNEKSTYKLVMLEDKQCEQIVSSLVKLDIPYSIYGEEMVPGINIGYGSIYGGFEIPQKD